MDHMIAALPKEGQMIVTSKEKCIRPLSISWVDAETEPLVFISKGKHGYKSHLCVLGQMTFADDVLGHRSG